ncbi:MAG TPA: hypothetical protein VMX18_03505 [Candidatus Bipolaricaulota bacterium]|nr:hypothetical protein [Candidatus Bipolaricaulota bacterium]
MNIFNSVKLRKISKISLFVMVLLILTNIALPSWAKETDNSGNINSVISANKKDIISENIIAYKEKQDKIKTQALVRQRVIYPKSKQGELWTTATAYTSTVDQCDASPCITADGYNVCAAGEENVIATNFLPFGTKVKIPELYGDKEFVVHDRMNRRYSNRVDIWMKDRSDAIQFGKQNVKIVVVE